MTKAWRAQDSGRYFTLADDSNANIKEDDDYSIPNVQENNLFTLVNTDGKFQIKPKKASTSDYIIIYSDNTVNTDKYHMCYSRSVSNPASASTYFTIEELVEP